MTSAPPCDRTVTARTRAKRRAVRARVAAAAAIVVVAWWTHAACATQESRPLGATPATAAAPANAAPGGWADAVRAGAALVVVIGLIGGAWWWLRRAGVGGGARGSAFEVMARQPVGRGQHVMVVRFGPRVLCVQQTRDGLRTLCELSDPAEIAALSARLEGGAFAARTRPDDATAEAHRTVDVRARRLP